MLNYYKKDCRLSRVWKTVIQEKIGCTIFDGPRTWRHLTWVFRTPPKLRLRAWLKIVIREMYSRRSLLLVWIAVQSHSNLMNAFQQICNFLRFSSSKTHSRVPHKFCYRGHFKVAGAFPNCTFQCSEMLRIIKNKSGF